MAIVIKILVKEGSNIGSNFGNILTNHVNFELKLGQYLYLYSMHQKMKTFFQICLKHAVLIGPLVNRFSGYKLCIASQSFNHGVNPIF